MLLLNPFRKLDLIITCDNIQIVQQLALTLTKRRAKMPKCWDCCNVDPLLVLLDQACSLGNDTPDGGDTEACEDFEPKLGYTLGFGSSNADDE